jgi:Ca2+-binding EF-hand superfamily protein
MQNLWRVFDLKKTGKVEIKELKRLMGALDF